jgi:hypothetical protein
MVPPRAPSFKVLLNVNGRGKATPSYSLKPFHAIRGAGSAGSG